MSALSFYGYFFALDRPSVIQLHYLANDEKLAARPLKQLLPWDYSLLFRVEG